MTPTAMLILDVTRRHMHAFQDKDEETRARLFRLLGDLEWAYPEALAEVVELYPTDTKREPE